MFKPMLASPVDLHKLVFPVLVSAKLDGVRAIVINGVVMSRKLKPIPNRHVQRLFSSLEGVDGELIMGKPTDTSCYRNTMSAVMTEAGEPDVKFWAFDHISFPQDPYTRRHETLTQYDHPSLRLLPQIYVRSHKSLEDLEQTYVSDGHEGVILRSDSAPYKFGRSTANEGYMLKLKRFSDAEFEVFGYEERMHNGNEATIGELGQTKRSSHKENMVGRGDLGAILLKHPLGVFSCGTGFTDAERALLWQQRETLVGRTAKIKFFEGGMKDFPRFPVFLGFRDGD